MPQAHGAQGRPLLVEVVQPLHQRLQHVAELASLDADIVAEHGTHRGSDLKQPSVEELHQRSSDFTQRRKGFADELLLSGSHSQVLMFIADLETPIPPRALSFRPVARRGPERIPPATQGLPRYAPL